MIELRRAEDGIRTWFAESGEYFDSFNAEYGGLGRRIGRPPNVMGGVGFIAQGFDVSSCYRRASDADNPRAASSRVCLTKSSAISVWLAAALAGIEFDRVTTAVGSPPNMLRPASSENHLPMMLPVNEEFGIAPPNLGGNQNNRVHTDLAFGETPFGGALFATSSIARCGSLSHNNYDNDNNVARITWHVLKRFSDPAPFSVG